MHTLPEDPPRDRPRRRTSAPLGVLFAVVVAVAGATGVITAAERQVGNVDRIENLEDILVAVDGPAVNYLLIGSDTREGSDPNATDADSIGSENDVTGRRSDTIIILRQEEDGNGAALLSLNRDLWVTHADTGSQQRINAAYNRGAEVLAATITQEYGIPINHVVDVDFFGFKDLIDTIGGTTICFDAPARDLNSGLNQEAGCNLLAGEQALAYARSRNYEEFRDGDWRKDGTADIGRVQRQQQFISATVNETLNELQSDPFLASELDRRHVGVAPARPEPGSARCGRDPPQGVQHRAHHVHAAERRCQHRRQLGVDPPRRARSAVDPRLFPRRRSAAGAGDDHPGRLTRRRPSLPTVIEMTEATTR